MFMRLCHRSVSVCDIKRSDLHKPHYQVPLSTNVNKTLLIVKAADGLPTTHIPAQSDLTVLVFSMLEATKRRENGESACLRA